jgi:D-alanyl-D-alanine carboxypeptidase/D-alanyl-D-alanine-endopeptidase (penicillin-binding protein 4)
MKSAGVSRGLENNHFYMWGANQNWGARVAVHNPAGWAAKSLKESLQKHGITIDGESKSIDWKSENKLDPGGAVELAFVEGQTLGEIVQKMNKHSVNLYGELILRMLGKHFGDSAPDEDAQLQVVRGDGASGAAVIKKWLREHHVATDEIQIHDGSGLSRLNFVSPEAFGRALIAAAQSNYAGAFVSSLPIAATDGTLGGRLGKVKGKVLAKTGTITFVNSLTGYAEGATDENFAFAIICNNQTRKVEPKAVIDAIATIIVNQGTDDSEKNGESDKNQNGLSENKSQKEEKPK